MDKLGSIYKIKNLVNGKVYIGQTIKKPEYRLSRHKKQLSTCTHNNKHLQNAYYKYGENNFKVSIIERVEINNLDDREKYWIGFYKSKDGVYNIEGGGNKNKFIPEETKKRISIAVKKALKRPEVIEKHRINAIKNRAGGNGNAKKVICISTGEIFNSIIEAADKYNLTISDISKNCTGERDSAGFHKNGITLQFAYYEKNKTYKLKNIKGLQKQRKVICTNTKEVFDSVCKAAKKYGLSQGSISKCCMGEIKSAGKLPNGEYSVWVYEEDYDANKDYYFYRHEGKHNPRARSVICLNTKEVFDTITEAAKKYNIGGNGSKICLVCKGERNTCGKLPDGTRLKWMYYEEYKTLLI